jgi:hypothetical protein
MPTRERRAKAVLRKALAALPKTVTLYYTSRSDDGLSNEQLQRIFDGDIEGVESELDEYGWEHVEYNIDYAIKEVLPDAADRDLLGDFPDLELELRTAIQERDDSKGPLLEQLAVTNGKLMRYYLDYDLEPGSWSWEADAVEKAMAEIAEAAGIEVEANRDTLWSLVAEATYGGSLYVIWYDDPEDVVMSVLNGQWGNSHVATTISWTDPQLVVLDSMNGSGMDGEVKGTVTKPFDPEKLSMDGKTRGYGYTWDDTASVVHSAYRCPVTLTYPDKEI